MRIKSIYHIPENKYDANPFSRSNIHNRKFRKIIKHITENFNYPTTIKLEKKIKGFKYAIYEGDAYHYNDTAMTLFDEYDCDLFDGDILGDIILYNNEKLHLHLQNLIKEYEKNESKNLELDENISNDEKINKNSNDEKINKNSNDEKINKNSNDEKINKNSNDEKINKNSNDEKINKNSNDEKINKNSNDEKINKNSNDEKINKNSNDEKIDGDSNKKKLTKEYQKYRNMILGININDFIE
ncbi:hypothetical protein QKC54_gp0886 [Megavirus baoshan]|uniref:Uncharacterized protein n=1 Tax=Megavirus baoshan TaxID=2496520 RepID=A0A8K1T1C3_9VIRU|nr:hypothetical protein QKC54_gp0886 [Megavirus baoshan]UFX99756.1 hypothetical protein Mb0186 [Megavirus baoshan]